MAKNLAKGLISFGIDHEKLTSRKDSIDRRLTDVHGHDIEEILV